jgi:hypothetical protein
MITAFKTAEKNAWLVETRRLKKNALAAAKAAS